MARHERERLHVQRVLRVAVRVLGPHDHGGRGAVGDAELDEGNVFEALLEGWKHDVRNVWWVIDYNRQSLDSVMPDRMFGRFEGLFRDMGWNVVSLKYGKALEAAFARPGGARRALLGRPPGRLRLTQAGAGAARPRRAASSDSNTRMRELSPLISNGLVARSVGQTRDDVVLIDASILSPPAVRGARATPSSEDWMNQPLPR